MCDPLPFGGKNLSRFLINPLQYKLNLIKNNNLLLITFGLMMIGVAGQLWNFQPAPYAQAYVGEGIVAAQLKAPLLEKQNIFPTGNNKINAEVSVERKVTSEETIEQSTQPDELERDLLSMVENTPIAEMVPFIAKRENKVAAFLIGIAKKESSFGLASPSKNGNDCHNYWGYKGVGSRGAVSGYSCFGSAQEAVEIVGNRIEVLVNKNQNTPTRIVDSWKCGKSCAGDPGAPGWVSTVALYFNKIVKAEG